MMNEKGKIFMKRLLEKLIVGGVGVSTLVACSADSINEEMSTLDATAANMTVAEVTVSSLEGTWNMYSMTSSDSVDFDQNDVYTYNLLEETDCFDPMYFDFGTDGTVATKQARLFFNSTGAFTCQDTGDYSATYDVLGNELSVTFTVDGMQYTETKTVSQYTENGEEFLKVTLTKQETNSAVYVANDPGTTVASEIQQIDMVYKKIL